MLKKIYIIILCGLFTSCVGKKETKVKVVAVQAEVITDSVYSRFPGSFFLLKDFVVWQDVFGVDGFLYILDRKNGKEVLKLGKIGQGPLEFATPEISCSTNSSVFIYDVNTKKQATLDLSKQNKKIKFIESCDDKYISSKLYVDSSFVVSSMPDSVKFIKTMINGNVGYLNCWVQDEISNRFDVFQGTILAYNREKIVYSANNFPYVSIYEKDDLDRFRLKTEIKNESKYSIVDKKLKIDANSFVGAFDTTLSKDYIVLLKFQKDNTKKRKNGIGRDISKLPQTLFVYSYEGELKKNNRFKNTSIENCKQS